MERTMSTQAVPGRYRILVTVTVFASNRQDAYRQVRNALSRRNDAVEFIDCEDIEIEPYCANLDDHGEYGDQRDLAVEGQTVCAACIAAREPHAFVADPKEPS